MGEREAGGLGGKELSSDDPLSPGDGWEDLELDRGPAESSTRKRPDFDPMMGSGRMLDDSFSGLGDGPVADLELESPAAPPAPSLASYAPPAAGTAQVERGSRTNLRPSGEPALDDLSPMEIAATADYGESPASIVMWVPYAILVLSRRLALKKALEDLKRLRHTAAGDEREALVELGRALHAKRDHEALRPLATQLAEADASGRVAAGRTDEWERSRQAADAQRSSLTAKTGEAEKAMGPYRDRETKLVTQMDTREQELRRAKARLSRVDIEIRNLNQAGQTEGAVDAGRLELLQAEREARSADVAKSQGHVDELAPQLAAARKELTVMLNALNDLEKQRRTVDEAQHRTERVHLSSAGEAENQYHAAVESIAQEAIKRKLAPQVEPVLSNAAANMKSALSAREREIRVHEAALHAYDKRAFQKGWAMIAVAGLIVLTMLILVIVR